MNEEKSSNEVLGEDKLVLLTAVSNNAPIDIVTRLISPSNISVKNDIGNTALHEAVKEERWELVPVLLQHGADVNLCNDHKQTSLHLAAQFGAPANIITHLISPHNINMQDGDGYSALQKAVKKKRWELVPVLVQYGAGVNMGDRWNRTPLHDAEYHDAPAEIVTRLISPHNINMKDKFDDTALHKAVEKKRWELVPILLQHGADVNLVEAWNKYTPLHWAAYHGAPADIINKLISHHNTNMKDKEGKTALHLTVIEKRWELVPVLLQHGADVNLVDGWNKHTPLHWASYHGAPVEVITLLISPHTTNWQDREGDTALHKAVEKKRWEVVPVLLKHGADVNRCNGYQETPLYWAAHLDAPANITAQLISPQNINKQGKVGDTVLNTVVGDERWELVPVLLKHGADPFTCDILPEPPRPLSLQSLCITTIRSHIAVGSDEAFERLGLPQRLIAELKLKPLADEIVAIKKLENLE